MQNAALMQRGISIWCLIQHFYSIRILTVGRPGIYSLTKWANPDLASIGESLAQIWLVHFAKAGCPL